MENQVPSRPFGCRVKIYCAERGMSLLQFAKAAGVNSGTLRECMGGRTPGHEVREKVNEYMLKQGSAGHDGVSADKLEG